jgi:hypothetical protein
LHGRQVKRRENTPIMAHRLRLFALLSLCRCIACLLAKSDKRPPKMATTAATKSEAHSDKRDGIAELHSATWACSYVFHNTSQSAHCQRAFSTSNPANSRHKARVRGLRLTMHKCNTRSLVAEDIKNPATLRHRARIKMEITVYNSAL